MILLSLLLLLALYIAVRKRFAASRYGVEIAFVAAVFLLSVAVKSLVIFSLKDTQQTGANAFLCVLSGLYGSLGGLQFEGLPVDGMAEMTVSATAAFWLRYAYYGTSILQGFVFCLLIMFGVSYEFYSALRLRMAKLGSVFTRKKDIFVFTALNEETLLLAKSIAAEYDGGKQGRKALLVFSGDALGTFDRHNELHREVMANSFLYCSYTKTRESKRRALTGRLHLHVQNAQFYTQFANKGTAGKAKRMGRFAVFAFSACNGYPDEETNSDLVFGDIRARLDAMAARADKKGSFGAMLRPALRQVLALCPPDEVLREAAKYGAQARDYDKVHIYEQAKRDLINGLAEQLQSSLGQSKEAQTVIDYYFLTKDGINYEAYQETLHAALVSTVYTVATGTCTDFDAAEQALLRAACERVCKWLLSLFRVRPICEADLAASDAWRRVYACLLQRGNAEGTEGFLHGGKDGVFKLWSLGFGGTGRSMLSKFYMLSAGLRPASSRRYRKALQFRADVFDEGEDASGTYAMSHPMMICVNAGPDTESELAQKQDKLSRRLWREVYRYGIDASKHVYPAFEPYPRPSPFPVDDAEERMREDEAVQAIAEEMGFPQIIFHTGYSCRGLQFKRKWDEVTGTSHSQQESAHWPDMFVVAMGDDDKNLDTANAALCDIKAEYLRGNGTAPRQILVVHIGDERNAARLNWTEADAAAFPNLVVVTVGERSRIFSYGSILDDAEEKLYNHNYSQAYDIACKVNLLEDDKLTQALTGVGEGDLQYDGVFYNLLAQKLLGKDSIDEGAVAVADHLADSMGGWNEAVAACERQWAGVTMCDKDSNRAATEFQARYISVLGSRSDFNAALIDCVRLEHHRWNCYHIANGWSYAARKNKSLRRHDCLLPFSLLNVQYILYDMINVVRAYKFSPAAQKDKT